MAVPRRSSLPMGNGSDSRRPGGSTRSPVVAAPRCSSAIPGPASGAGIVSNTAWLDDGSVVFLNRARADLMQQRADGTLRVVASMPGTEFPLQLVPLPGSRGVLMTQCAAVPCVAGHLSVLDLRHDSIRILADDVSWVGYLDAGYAVYGRGDGTLVAQRFDAEHLELSGPPVAVLDGVASIAGLPQFVLAPNGTMLYGSGGSVGLSRRGALVDLDRSGRETVIDSGLSLPPSIGSAGVSLSPDGNRVALVQVNSDGSDIYIKTLPDGPMTRLTFDGRAARPSWSPDGRDVLYVASSGVTQVLMRVPAGGGGTPTEILRDTRPVAEGLLSPDGQWLVWRTDDVAEGKGDILARRTSGDTTTIVLAGGPFSERSPAISPDSRWVAYASNQNGEIEEVFVRALSDSATGKWQVSDGDGSSPQWSQDGRELFYGGTDDLMVARVETSPTFRVLNTQGLMAGDPSWLFEVRHPTYAVLGNGHFLILRREQAAADSTTRTRIILVEHWLGEIGPMLGK